MDSLLAGWENFYVIVGSSAGGLTGLTFVVIALAADSNRVRVSGLRAFVTPIIVHFGIVLALAAFLSMPHPSILALSLGFAAIAATGLIWSVVIVRNMPKPGSDYVPVAEDWLWNVILPGAGVRCSCSRCPTWSGTTWPARSTAWRQLRSRCCSSASTTRGTSRCG